MDINKELNEPFPEKLIDVVKKLHGVFSSTHDLREKVELPEIVVIGEQSSGKSSVLESFVGRDFLPRGTGIVTRRPLVLDLNHCPINDPLRTKYSVGQDKDFAIFGHKSEKAFMDFEEICNEIEVDTEKEAGPNKEICEKEIRLSIYSNKMVHQLSLVDLPGITKNDIEEQTRKIIMKYIRNSKTIILAVTPANVDIANSYAIKLAKDADPQGKRTLTVLTKLDLMDQGTNAMELLTGKIIPIKRGIIGVINRSQKDINNKKSMEACLEYERNILHRDYPSIANKNGIPYLKRTLHEILMEHIHDNLPNTKARIDQNIGNYEKQLQELGHTVIDPQAKLVDLIGKFVPAYIDTIMGGENCMDKNNDSKTKDDLLGGAKISWIFHTLYAQDLKAINLADELNTEYIYQTKRQTEGLHPSIIVPEKCFEKLSSKQIKRMEEPSLNCVDRVKAEMIKAIDYCKNDYLDRELKRFPAFAVKIYNFIHQMLDERSKKAKKLIQKSIKSHVRFINTKHPDFSSEHALLMMLVKLDPNISALAQQHSFLNSNPFGTKLMKEIKESDDEIGEKYVGEITTKMEKVDWERCIFIQCRLVEAYFKIVLKSVEDHTPKQIYSEVIHYLGTKRKLQTKLTNKFLAIQKEEMGKLFNESEEVTQRRLDTVNRLEALRKAKQIVDELFI